MAESYAYYPITQYSNVLRIVQECEAVCENTFTAVLGRQDVSSRVTQLQLLRDCADICTLTAKYIARCSMFARSLAALCAQVCEVCGNHCLRMPDPVSQHCGRICMDCARECRAYAGQASYPTPGYQGPGYSYSEFPGVYSQSEKENENK
ncbi:four-helix bundle copper-binding protein [Desulfoscipio geothermicus]|uniref:Ferredoxin n=1 Tax=Desulfoscipio geothermicus DSM 3669 TaxID=1121426 RepID=A0A1I6DUV2_9FIRM|nr:four-helix bundle copper-binding protein [Desulfoscipio geothermicus]SFR09215.1 hypothetical protein SAMN05660706_11830 [Desulfoscipio geothermicus DSM 3669]